MKIEIKKFDFLNNNLNKKQKSHNLIEIRKTKRVAKPSMILFIHSVIANTLHILSKYGPDESLIA
jgi:hypothetical protein